MKPDGGAAPESSGGSAEPESAAAPLPPIEWRANPWRADPRRAGFALASLAVLGFLLASLGLSPLTAMVLWLVFLITLAPAFAPLRCRVDGDGVARRLWISWERRPWDHIRRARLGPAGLFVSSQSAPGALDSFRGLWLPLDSAPSAPDLLAELRQRIEAHGL